MTLEELYNDINTIPNELQPLLNEKSPFIAMIDGGNGVGKSTIIQAIKTQANSQIEILTFKEIDDMKKEKDFNEIFNLLPKIDQELFEGDTINKYEKSFLYNKGKTKKLISENKNVIFDRTPIGELANSGNYITPEASIDSIFEFANENKDVKLVTSVLVTRNEQLVYSMSHRVISGSELNNFDTKELKEALVGDKDELTPISKIYSTAAQKIDENIKIINSPLKTELSSEQKTFIENFKNSQMIDNFLKQSNNKEKEKEM